MLILIAKGSNNTTAIITLKKMQKASQTTIWIFTSINAAISHKIYFITSGFRVELAKNFIVEKIDNSWSFNLDIHNA